MVHGRAAWVLLTWLFVSASASPFRYATISYQRVKEPGHTSWQTSNTIEFSSTFAFNASEFGEEDFAPGDPFSYGDLVMHFGDAQSTAFSNETCVVTLHDDVEDVVITQCKVTHTYSPVAVAALDNKAAAYVETCCRPVELQNNPNTTMRIAAGVDFRSNATSGMVLGTTPTVRIFVPVGEHNFTFTPVLMADPLGRIPHFRFATSQEMSGSAEGSGAPDGMTIDPVTGSITWVNATGTVNGGLYSLQLVVTDGDRTAAVDFLVELHHLGRRCDDASGAFAGVACGTSAECGAGGCALPDIPTFVAPSPPAGTRYVALVGAARNLSVAARSLSSHPGGYLVMSPGSIPLYFGPPRQTGRNPLQHVHTLSPSVNHTSPEIVCWTATWVNTSVWEMTTSLPYCLQVQPLLAPSYSTAPPSVHGSQEFAIYFEGQAFAEGDLFQLVDAAHSPCGNYSEPFYAVTQGMLNPERTRVDASAVTLESRPMRATVCYRFGDNPWFALDAPLAIAGPHGYASAEAPVLQLRNGTIVVRGVGLAAADRVAVALQPDDDCDSPSAAFNVTEEMVLDDETVELRDLRLTAGVYHLCYQSHTWHALQPPLEVTGTVRLHTVPAVPVSRANLTLVVEGVGLSTADHFAIALEAEECTAVARTNVTSGMFTGADPPRATLTIPVYPLVAGAYRVCYFLKGEPDLFEPAFSVQGVYGYAVTPAQPQQTTNFTLSMLGIRLSTEDTYGFSDEAAGCDSLSDGGVWSVHSGLLTGSTGFLEGGLQLPAGRYVVCYNVNRTGWLQVGPAFVVLGPTGYVTDPAPVPQDVPFTLTVAGHGLSEWDQWDVVLTATEACGDHARNVTGAGLNATNDTVRVVLEARDAESYTVCYKFRHMAWQGLGAPLLVRFGAAAIGTDPAPLLPYQRFNLTLTAAGLAAGDRYALRFYADACRDAGPGTNVTGEMLNGTALTVPALSLPAGEYTVCYQLGDRLWVPFGFPDLGPVVVRGAAYFRTEPEEASNLLAFTPIVTGNGMSTGDRYAVVGGTGDVGYCESQLSPTGGAPAAPVDNTTVVLAGMTKSPGDFTVCYRLDGDVWNAVPRRTGEHLIVAGAVYALSDPVPVLVNSSFNLWIVGFGFDVAADRYAIRSGAEGCAMDSGANFSAAQVSEDRTRVFVQGAFVPAAGMRVCYNARQVGWLLTALQGPTLSFTTSPAAPVRLTDFTLTLRGATGALSEGDQYALVPVAHACHGALNVSNTLVLGAGTNATVASDAFGSSLTVAAVNVPAGAYHICYAPAGQAWVHHQELRVAGGVSWSTAGSPAHGVPFAIELQGFGLSRNDSVKVVPSGAECGVWLGGPWVPGANLTDGMVDAAGEAATLPGLQLPAGLFDVCHDLNGYGALRLPGSLVVAGATRWGSDPAPPARASNFTFVVYGHALSADDRVKLVDTSAHADCHNDTHPGAEVSAPDPDRENSVNVTDQRLDAGRYLVCYNVRNTTWVPQPQPLDVFGASGFSTTPALLLRDVDWLIAVRGHGLGPGDAIALVAGADEACAAAVYAPVYTHNVTALEAVTVDGVSTVNVTRPVRLPAGPYTVCYRLFAHAERDDTDPVWVMVGDPLEVLPGAGAYSVAPAQAADNTLFSITFTGTSMANGDRFAFAQGGCGGLSPGSSGITVAGAAGDGTSVTEVGLQLAAGVYDVCYSLQGLDFLEVGGNLTVAGAAAWTTDPAAVENYENFTVTITGFNLSAADKYAVVNARTSLSGCDQPSNPAYVSDAAVDGLSVGIPGLLALPAGVYLICYNTGGISYLDSAAPYVAVGPPLRVQGVEFFSSDPTPPTDDAPFTVTFHGLGLNTTDRYQVVVGTCVNVTDGTSTGVNLTDISGDGLVTVGPFTPGPGWAVCYSFNGQEYQVVDFGGAVGWASDPSPPYPEADFDLVVTGASLSVLDKFAFVPGDAVGCAPATSGDARPYNLTAPDVAPSRARVNVTAGTALSAGMYTVCYAVDATRFVSIGHTLTVGGATGFASTPSFPKQYTGFTLRLDGYLFGEGDRWAVVPQSEGCAVAAEARARNVSGATFAMDAYNVTSYTVAADGQDAGYHDVCYDFQGSGWLKVGTTLRIDGALAYSHGYPIANEVFTLTITGLGLSNFDSYAVVPEAEGCGAPTAVPVAGVSGTTSATLSVSRAAGSHVVCYLLLGAAWKQVGAPFVVNGASDAYTTPHPAARMTNFTLVVSGSGFDSGDKVATVPAAMSCSAVSPLTGGYLSVGPDMISPDNTTVNATLVQYAAGAYKVCYNVQDLGWQQVGTYELQVAGVSSHTTIGSPAAAGVRFTLNLHGSFLTDEDVYGIATPGQECDNVTMVAVSAGWVSGGGALVAVPEQQLDATGTYTVCYNFRGLGLLSITDLVVVSGAVAFRTVGSLGQYQSFSLIVDGAGLSTADRYALVANATADCFELTDLGTLILAGQLAGSTQVNIPTLQMGAGLYRVCYQLGTNVARQVAGNYTIFGATQYTTLPATPSRNNQFNLTIYGYGLSGDDKFALIEGHPSTCDDSVGGQQITPQLLKSDEEVNAMAYTYAAGTYTVCYRWGFFSWAAMQEPLVVLGATGYSTTPSQPTDMVAFTVTILGSGFSTDDNYALLESASDCSGAGGASQDVTSGMIGVGVVTLPSQTLPPNAHTVCYQLDGDNGGTWLKIGADFEVAGATHYTVVPSPLYVQTAFTLSIHGYAFTSADQWAWGAAADACIAPTARDTSEGSLGNNLFTIGMTEAAGNYSVCWSPRGTAWQMVGTALVSGASTWETLPAAPEYDSVFVLRMHGFGFSTADSYGLALQGTTCAATSLYPVTALKLQSDTYVSGTDSLSVPPGAHIVCYDIAGQGAVAVADPVYIPGATGYTMSPTVALDNRNFMLQFTGYGLKTGDLIALVPATASNPCASPATSHSASPRMAGGADAQLMVSTGQVFNRPAGEYAACYNWNGKGWVMAGTNITVSDGFSHFIVTPDPPTALQPMELQLLGNDFGAGDRYAFVSWKYETCDQGTPYPVTSAMFTEGNDRVVNVTGLTLEAGVWRLCYKFGTNDWMSSASNLTVTGARYYAINNTKPGYHTLYRQDVFYFQLFGIALSEADRYDFYPHANKCPDAAWEGLPATAPPMQEGVGHQVIHYQHRLPAGQYTVCYKWRGYEYVQIGVPLTVLGPRMYHTNPSPPVSGVAFEVRLLGFGLIGGVNFTVVSGASCGGAALTPAAPMAAAAAAGGGTLLSATYTAAFADFASEYTVCYDFRGLGAEAVPFWGVWDWVSAPALVAGDQAFAVTLQGVAGFSMWDEWRLIVKRNGVCETLGTGHAVLPDMLFGRGTNVTIPDQALAPDEYLICYNLGFGWFTVTRSLLVDGGAWLELSPVVPVHLSAFAMTIHGVHLTAGDKYGIIKSEAGCDSLGAGGDSVAALLTGGPDWYEVAVASVTLEADDYNVCYNLNGGGWRIVEQNMTVNGPNDWRYSPADPANNVMLRSIVLGHNLSVADMYEFAPAGPEGCTNVTGWDVFPWMLASDNGGAYNTTVYLPQQKLLAGVWVLCYHFPGLGWRQIGHNFTVAGPLRFEWVPHTPKRRTFFPLLVYGVGLNATDEWALVFGDNAAKPDLCYHPENFQWRVQSVDGDVDPSGVVAQFNASVSKDVWKTFRVWTLCYNVRGVAYGWEPVPGSSIHFLDRLIHVRITFSCTPPILQTLRTTECIIRSYDSAGELYGDDTDTAKFSVEHFSPSLQQHSALSIHQLCAPRVVVCRSNN